MKVAVDKGWVLVSPRGRGVPMWKPGKGALKSLGDGVGGNINLQDLGDSLACSNCCLLYL